jgi:positive regulator of sigma E activity
MIVTILCLFILVFPPVGALTLPDVTVQHHAFTRTSEEWEYLGDHITGSEGISTDDLGIKFRDYSMALEAYRATSGPRDWKYYAHVSSLERKLATVAGGLAYRSDDPIERSLWETMADNAERASDRDSQQSTTLFEDDRSTFGCLIVTAAYGSPLASEVQLVRDYRDGTIRQSYTGSQFFLGFNAWYYSFSPAVAGYIATSPLAKSIMQVYLVPLLEIVLVSRNLAAVLWFSPEIATICVLLFGAASYSVVYIFPAALLTVWLAGRRGWKVPAPERMKPVFILWVLMLAGLAAGIVLSADLLTVVSSGLLVASTVALVAGTGSLAVMQYLKKNRSSPVPG